MDPERNVPNGGLVKTSRFLAERQRVQFHVELETEYRSKLLASKYVIMVLHSTEVRFPLCTVPIVSFLFLFK